MTPAPMACANTPTPRSLGSVPEEMPTKPGPTALSPCTPAPVPEWVPRTAGTLDLLSSPETAAMAHLPRQREWQSEKYW